MNKKTNTRKQNKAGKTTKLTAKESHAITLLNNGVPSSQVSQITGLGRQRLTNLLEVVSELQIQITDFRSHRADLQALIQSKSLDVNSKLLDVILDKLSNKAEVKRLSPRDISDLIKVITQLNKTSYDQERTETGKATNITENRMWSLISRQSDNDRKQQLLEGKLIAIEPTPPDNEKDGGGSILESESRRSCKSDHHSEKNTDITDVFPPKTAPLPDLTDLTEGDPIDDIFGHEAKCRNVENNEDELIIEEV